MKILLSEKDKEIIRCLQDDLPLCSNPYYVLAQKVGISEEEMLHTINKYLEKGILRRFGAVIKHQQAGFSNNVLVVWEVPPEKISEIGRILSSFPEVSHCYQRPTRPHWPYNLFSMIHATSKAECEKTIQKISKTIDIADYLPLYSLKEFKKVSMRYFEE